MMAAKVSKWINTGHKNFSFSLPTIGYSKMNHKMKKIWIALFFACACFFGATITNGQTTYPLAGHPRLFFLSADEAVLKAKINSTPVLKRVHDLIVAESDKMLASPYRAKPFAESRF
jgi:hypothetical protein